MVVDQNDIKALDQESENVAGSCLTSHAPVHDRGGEDVCGPVTPAFLYPGPGLIAA